jgi:post-GPI attachment to proteins factor 3
MILDVLYYKKGMEERFSYNLIDLLRYKKFDVSTFENLVPWNCRDECKYGCMHKTTEAFIARKWKIPQFHGKWPFVRFLGIQEPASVVFSALNFYIHLKCLMQFRNSVRADSPFYKVWHVFSIISLNAWTWSTVFHSRDFPLTELLDYVFAYSMVLASFWCMTIR